MPTHSKGSKDQRIKGFGKAVVEGLRETSDTTFLKAWWALCWLYPGLHPDNHEE